MAGKEKSPSEATTSSAPKKKRVTTKRGRKTGARAGSGSGGDNRSRVKRIKDAQKEALREHLKGREYLRQLEEIGEKYAELNDRLSTLRKEKLTAKNMKQKREVSETIDIVTLELKVLKDRMDLNFRRLKFVLPELRSVELQDTQGNNPFEAFTEAVLAAAGK